MSKHFLVATDGSPSAEGALRLAIELAKRGGVVEVLSVVDASPPAAGVGMEVVVAAYQALDARALEARRAAVESQLAALAPEAGSWPLHVETGEPGPTIARVAKERGASMIVVGLRARTRFQRLIRSETALGVIHTSNLPVLAVPQKVAGLPRRALVGLDFNDATGDALQPVLPILGDSPTVHLAHIATPLAEAGGYEEWHKTYLYGAASRLEEIAGRLWADAEIHVETHVASGEPEDALLEMTSRLHVDLIAIGTHAYGMLHRALIPSVSTGLLRRAACSVLLTTHTQKGDPKLANASGEPEPLPWI